MTALYESQVDSPVGSLRCVVDETGAVVRIGFPGEEPRPHAPGEPLAVDRDGRRAALLACQLSEYFAGTRERFDVRLAARGTEFQQAVWAALRRIPYGETRSYAEIARAVGRPRAVRAVGSANGANPIPIVVPCHRVIGADGSLTGFGGGLGVKAFLLDLEKRQGALAL